MVKAANVHDILSKYMLVDGFHVVVDLQKSHGSILVDANSGKEYIDFFMYFASNALGHNHPALMEPEFKEKLLWAAINKPSNSDMYTIEMAEFVQTFMDIAAPEYMQHLFMIDGGALAVENALKTAFDWKVRRNFKRGYKQEVGYKILHFKQAFHGRSGYTLSLTNTFDPRKTKYFPKFDWPRLENPKLEFPVTEDVIQKVQRIEEQVYDKINAICREEGDDIAALIIEPIQGEGGDNHFRKEFFIELANLAKEHDFLFIVDEVQTGLGMTGKMWAHEWYDVQPDILSFGKKTQVCGILAGERVMEVENNVFEESSRINSTWGGNLVDMVRSSQILKTIRKENLVENARDMGEYILEQLHQLNQSTHSIMSNIRGKGLFIAFDVPNTEIREQVMQRTAEKGLLVLKSGEKSIRFRPALTVDKDTIDQAMKILHSSLEAVTKKSTVQ